MKTKIYHLSLKSDSPTSGYWDFAILDLLDYEHENVSVLPRKNRAIVTIPARYHAGLEQKLNKELAKIKHVILFLMGDEEAEFNVEVINHPSIHIWVQNAHPDKHDKYNRIGTGYPPQVKLLSQMNLNKTRELMFSGQITHERRRQMVEGLNNYHGNAFLHYSRGFTQGLQPKDYYNYMISAKIAPAPSGAVVPDSFRLFEALEAMCVPIADEVNPSGTINEYWDWLLGMNPIPKITNWLNVDGTIKELLKDYPRNLHQITCWWIKWKRDFKLKIIKQLNDE